ncbi:MAG: ROK family protein [Vicinamibacteria bacterium]
MRPVHAQNVRVATRGTTREINRGIALNLIRTNQPISRADLARLMGTRRGAVSLLVNELIQDEAVFEGATGEAKRGRKPTFLYIDSRKRCVVAVDIRPTRTFIMVTDLMGQQLATVTSFPTERDPKKFVLDLVRRIKAILVEHKDLGRCQGIGVVVPGMVESAEGRVLLAPNLGWKDVLLRGPIAAAMKIPVQIENSGKACALAQLWASRDAAAPSNFAYVTVSDGVGVGVVMGNQLVRGQHNIAGEFGHIPLNVDGPRCGCGATGCWEAYVSNLATLSRYFGRDLRDRPLSADVATLTVDDLIARARGGDGKALAALLSTGRYLGLGLGSVVNAIDPSHVYIGGEITAAWDLIEATVRSALAERALTPPAGATPITVVPPEQYPRLRGAAALVAAPSFAERVVA